MVRFRSSAGTRGAGSNATEDELAAGPAQPQASAVRSITRKKPVRAPLPAHLPRERVVVPAPPCCPGCGKLVKLGEDVTETLEVVPRKWKVIHTVREKPLTAPARPLCKEQAERHPSLSPGRGCRRRPTEAVSVMNRRRCWRKSD